MTAVSLSGFCRVTVVAPTARADLALAAQVPVAALLPVLLRELGDAYDGPQATVGWELRSVAGRLLAADASLTGSGVLDGDVLVLRPASVPLAPALIDDVVDELATAPRPPLDARVAAAVACGIAGPAAGVAVLVLPGSAWVRGPVLAAAGLALCAVGVLGRRWVAAALGVVWLALGSAGLPVGAGRLPVGLAVAAAACAALLTLRAAPAVRACWLGGAVASAVAAVGSAVGAAAGSPSFALPATVTSVVAVAASTRVPRLALRLAGVRRAVSTGPADAAALARLLHSGAAAGVFAALGASGLALSIVDDPWARGLGALVAVLALLRAPLHGTTVALTAGALAGVAAGAAAGVRAAAAGGPVAAVAVPVGCLLVAAVASGATPADPRWRRLAAAAETALTLALPPLAAAAAGLVP